MSASTSTPPTLPLTYDALANEDLTASCVVVHRTIPSPLPPNQLLIHVTHSSLNYMDCKMQRRNVFQLPMPLVLGFDFAGVVAAIGSSVNDPTLQVGTQVVGGSFLGGGFGQYHLAEPSHVVPARGMPSAEGSTLGIAFGTAYEGIDMELKAATHKGKTILIPGAAGGCGHFAVQLARRAGLRVIGTTSKAAGAAMLREMGVERVIDYAKEDVVKEVMAWTEGRGVDLVWDSTYKMASLQQSAACVAKGGHWCVLGTAPQMQNAGVEDYDALFKVAEGRGAKATHSDYGRWLRPGSPESASRPDIRRELLEVGVDYWVEGTVKPRITQELPFEAAALQRVLDEMFRGNNNVGKVVVKVDA